MTEAHESSAAPPLHAVWSTRSRQCLGRYETAWGVETAAMRAANGGDRVLIVVATERLAMEDARKPA